MQEARFAAQTVQNGREGAEAVDLINLLLDNLFDKPAKKYPILAGVPLMLLPVFIMTGMVYFLAHMY
ncbi:MAG TPA: hypothetical protein VE891_10025 [Allosphingosinicella sp.]|nr:hypothetical protein [Allosphingosinicella sp.]